MSHRQALGLLLILQLLYFHRVILDGEVIYPHNNAAPLCQAPLTDHWRNYYRFTDHSDFYIPEFHQTLHGRSRAWLSTWNPHTELGRPTAQRSGFGKASPYTFLLSLFTRDTLRFYTWLAVGTVCLSGVFFFAFVQALGLGAPACLCSAAGLSLGVYNSCWLTFPMYLSTISWSAALLWLVTLFIRRPTWIVALGVSFATYSLLVTGYAQFIVFQVYLLAGFSVLQVWRTYGSWRQRIMILCQLAGLALSGAFMSAPVYLDLAIDAGRSNRGPRGPELAFSILDIYCNYHDFGELAKYLSLVYDTFWYGNPLDDAFPFKGQFEFLGLSFTPFYGSLLVVSLLLTRRRPELFLWQGIGALCLVGTVWPAAYWFAIQRLGFHLSQFEMLRGATMPAFVVVAYTVDVLVREGLSRRVLACVLVAALWTFGTAAAAIGAPAPLHAGYVVVGLLLVAGTMALLWTRNVHLLHGLAAVTVCAYGYRIMLTRPPGTIHMNSTFVEKVRAALPEGSRFAKCGKEAYGLIVHNQESILGLKSIHSFNSLASGSFNRLAERLNVAGGGVMGIYCGWVEPAARLNDPILSYCGVGLVLSKQPLDPTRYQLVDEYFTVKFYQPVAPPILMAQLPMVVGPNACDVHLEESLAAHAPQPVQLMESFDDWRRYAVKAAETPTLFFISQQYHPSWKATSGRQSLRTVEINGFFQGVVVPPGVQTVTMEFRPWSLWSWVPWVCYAGGGFTCLATARWRRRSAQLELRVARPVLRQRAA